MTERAGERPFHARRRRGFMRLLVGGERSARETEQGGRKSESDYFAHWFLPLSS
jgi:hypothetical protein